jgi:CRISPR type I-E-associated protein CasB/Cse2
VSATDQFVQTLAGLKPGDLALLRAHSGAGLDETVAGFDLFAGLWWPLRQQSQRAPRREVAWLVAKLLAARPIPHAPGDAQRLARQLARCQPSDERARVRFQDKFDQMLSLPVDEIEPSLRWALGRIADAGGSLDWVALTDDLSLWNREKTRLGWAKQFLETDERR